MGRAWTLFRQANPNPKVKPTSLRHRPSKDARGEDGLFAKCGREVSMILETSGQSDDDVMESLARQMPYGIQVHFSKCALGEHASEASPNAP